VAEEIGRHAEAEVTRRAWLGLSAAASFADLARPAGRIGLRAEVVRLKLRHTWTTTMSSSEFRDTLHVTLSADGITGRGEGAPIVRYGETAADGKRWIESIAPAVAQHDPRYYTALLESIFAAHEGQWAAKSALDIALMDWTGQKLGVPLHRLFGLDPNAAPVTTFSIGIDTPEMTQKKVLEAAAFPVLKIKVGLERDEATLEAVRSVTKKPLRVDANEGFKTKEEALRKIKWLEGLNVELIEQPMPAAMLEEQRWLRRHVDMPIFADESCLHPADVPRIADAYDGIVVKLDKSGGTLKAMEMIRTAESLGLQTMIGCMVSSSVTITAAAQISPLARYADLDGNLLIANDPYTGVRVNEGKLILPAGNGLGLTAA
jgi:L-alanine-DL-glutamate epimerase-like enolase superfamily enzyme